MHTFLWETNLKVKQKYNQCGVENLVDSISEIRKELCITRCDCVLLSCGRGAGRMHLRKVNPVSHILRELVPGLGKEPYQNQLRFSPVSHS